MCRAAAVPGIACRRAGGQGSGLSQEIGVEGRGRHREDRAVEHHGPADPRRAVKRAEGRQNRCHRTGFVDGIVDHRTRRDDHLDVAEALRPGEHVDRHTVTHAGRHELGGKVVVVGVHHHGGRCALPQGRREHLRRARSRPSRRPHVHDVAHADVRGLDPAGLAGAGHLHVSRPPGGPRRDRQQTHADDDVAHGRHPIASSPPSVFVDYRCSQSFSPPDHASSSVFPLCDITFPVRVGHIRVTRRERRFVQVACSGPVGRVRPSSPAPRTTGW